MAKSNLAKISPKDRLKILTLSRIRGVGPRVFAKLVREFKSVDEIFSCGLRDIAQVVGWSVANLIKDKKSLTSTEKYCERIEKAGISFTAVLDSNYPSLLKEICDPPIVLYYKGDFRSSDFGRCFSIVGTRNSTRYGEEATRELTKGLVDAGFTIVSGMAFGIDKTAHEAAIECGGRTIAVLSGNVSEPSPRSNFKIYEKILRNGCAVSGTHVDTELKAGMFPPRNRIISGLSVGTLVVEAGKKSGALITARLALEQDREVFAVPSGIFSQKGKGTNKLIQKGEAKLVQDVYDILEEFGFKFKDEQQQQEKILIDPEERKILDTLIRGPLCIDEMSCLTGMEVSELSRILTMMELARKVAKVEGNRYVILK